MEEDEELDNLIAGEQQKISKVPIQLQPWQYKKGQSGNPAGRAKGISLKEYVKKNFIHMTDEEKENFLNGIGKTDVWKMGEGSPDSKTDITSGGEKLEMNAENLAKIEAFNQWHKQQTKQSKK